MISSPSWAHGEGADFLCLAARMPVGAGFLPTAALLRLQARGPRATCKEEEGRRRPCALLRGSVGPALVEGRRRFRVVIGEGSVLPAGWHEINGSCCRVFLPALNRRVSHLMAMDRPWCWLSLLMACATF